MSRDLPFDAFRRRETLPVSTRRERVHVILNNCRAALEEHGLVDGAALLVTYRDEKGGTQITTEYVGNLLTAKALVIETVNNLSQDHGEDE